MLKAKVSFTFHWELRLSMWGVQAKLFLSWFRSQILQINDFFSLCLLHCSGKGGCHLPVSGHSLSDQKPLAEVLVGPRLLLLPDGSGGRQPSSGHQGWPLAGHHQEASIAGDSPGMFVICLAVGWLLPPLILCHMNTQGTHRTPGLLWDVDITKLKEIMFKNLMAIHRHLVSMGQ